MSDLTLGLVHTPVTPFKIDIEIDYPRYRDIIEFHIRNGAEALALPMHVGESVSLSDAERRKLLEFALEVTKQRVPIIAHITQSGTSVASDLARHAEQAGAAAIICTTPYYWKPQPAMMLNHFAEIGASVQIPFFIYNAPTEMGGTKVTTDLVLELLKRLDNFVGLVDISLDWQFLIDVVSNARSVKPDFQLLSGLEFLISSGAIGATGAFAPHATLAPQLVKKLYELCAAERFEDARPLQEEFARLYQAVKRRGASGIKAAAELMGRECGNPRPPILPLNDKGQRSLGEEMMQIPALRLESKGW